MNDGPAPMACRSNIVDHVRHLIRCAGEAAGPGTSPFVTLTYAQSVDGCIARQGGETLQLSNALAQKMTHQIRASHAAIMVGINTVIRDDPQLTVRLVPGQNPQPVVLDSRLRFPPDAMLLKEPCVPPILFSSHDAPKSKERQLTGLGARVVRVRSTPEGRIDLVEALQQLKSLGYESLMVEGGARVITSVLRQRLAHQLLLTISPRFVGGLRAVNGTPDATDDPKLSLPQLCNIHYQWLAEDLILRADFAVEAGLDTPEVPTERAESIVASRHCEGNGR